ncbi:MAG: HEAT repeat domain-containing protein [Pirellulales bacterium]|nr:HEAT repeat domain-containing protein [Pirellulales bacterium]
MKVCCVTPGSRVRWLAWAALWGILAGTAPEGAVAQSAAAAPPSAAAANDELIQLITGLIAESDPDLRAVGLEQIRKEAPGEAATRQFAAQLPKLSPENQAALVSALADRGDMAAREPLIALLEQKPAENVQVAILAGLGQLGLPGDASLLIERLASDKKPIVAAAVAALIRLRGDDVPANLAGQLGQTSGQTAVKLTEVLAARRVEATIPALLQAGRAPDAAVRKAALLALAQFAGPEHLPELFTAVLAAQPGAERDAAERAVMTICNREPNAERRAEIFLNHLKMLPPGDQLQLLSTAGRVGGEKILRRLEDSLASETLAEHQAGLRGICNWPDATIAPRLLELTISPLRPADRPTTLAALVRVAVLPDKRTDGERLDMLKQAWELSSTEAEKNAVLKRARVVRTIDSLRFLRPFLTEAPYAQMAAESIVELAHHRGLREPNDPEFHQALDQVMAVSRDEVVIDRAKRYKNDQTWVRPKAAATE